MTPEVKTAVLTSIIFDNIADSGVPNVPNSKDYGFGGTHNRAEVASEREDRPVVVDGPK